MKSPSPPPAPDPVATASAQAGANRDTALAQTGLNMVNQVGPNGSLTYNQTGQQEFTNSLDGSKYSIPQYTATTTLSPAGQQLQATNDQTQQNIAQIGQDQSARIGDLLGQPVNLNNDAVESRLYDLGSKRLDPRFAQDEESLRTRLVNQGIGQGSAAWTSAMNDFTQGKNDAYNQLLLNGRGQSVQEILAERNQPINEISALLSGSQVSQPNFVNTPQTQVANTDYQGAVGQSYNAQQNAYNQQMTQNNATMGGLFGLAGTLGAGAMRYSDRRLKRNIERLGTRPDGLGIYAFDYAWGGPRQIGVMADEVEAVYPQAVHDINGWKAVDYGAL